MNLFEDIMKNAGKNLSIKFLNIELLSSFLHLAGKIETKILTHEWFLENVQPKKKKKGSFYYVIEITKSEVRQFFKKAILSIFQ